MKKYERCNLKYFVFQQRHLISPILKLPWYTIIKYDFQFSIPIGNQLAVLLFTMKTRSLKRKTCAYIFFSGFFFVFWPSNLLSHLFSQFLWSHSKKVLLRVCLLLTLIHVRAHCYSSFVLTRVVYANVWVTHGLFIQSAIVGVWIISRFLLLWYSHIGVWKVMGKNVSWERVCVC